MNKTFLKRNLKDMRDQGRKSQPRKTMKVEDWIGKFLNIHGNYMSLKFIGVFGLNLTSNEVEIRPKLLNIVHNRRKHDRIIGQEMCDTVIVHPNNTSENGKIPAISIAVDKTGTSNEAIHLEFTVEVLQKCSPRPLSKKRKILDNIKYESQFIVVEKFQRRLLMNGEYEVPLQLAKDLPGSHVAPNMNLLKENSIQGPPKLKFSLEWTRDKLDGLVDRPATICVNESNNENLPDQNCSSSLQYDPSGLRSLVYVCPVRRTVATEMLFYRPKRKLPEFNQIDEFVDEANNQEPFDDRLGDESQPHTISPVCPIEFDIDPEDENMPVWLQIKPKMMIDKLAGVDEDEKALMKMWNIHIMKCGLYTTDIKLRDDCKSFIEQNGRKILEMKLYDNFVLLMVNLYDRRIISPSFFKICIVRMEELARDI